MYAFSVRCIFSECDDKYFCAEPKIYCCPDCKKMLASRQSFREHIRRHTGESFICDLCGQKFNTNSGFCKFTNLLLYITPYDGKTYCSWCNMLGTLEKLWPDAVPDGTDDLYRSCVWMLLLEHFMSWQFVHSLPDVPFRQIWTVISMFAVLLFFGIKGMLYWNAGRMLISFL